jgi:hypothetical protein
MFSARRFAARLSMILVGLLLIPGSLLAHKNLDVFSFGSLPVFTW